MYNILSEINLENGSKYKARVITKHKDNKTLYRVFQMAYDTVKFSYGVGKTTLEKIEYPWVKKSTITIDEALDILENEFCTKRVTGNAAIARLGELFSYLDSEDRYVISRVIERDLRINFGKTQINKIFNDIITKPVYMRCDVYSSKSAKNVKFPAYVQLKADGTYREFTVHNGVVTSRSRSGETYVYPVINKQMRELPDGVYIGELTIMGEKDRAKGNGLINSDNPPHNDIIVQFWDFVTHDEYNLAKEKDRKRPCKTPYEERFNKLKEILQQYMGRNVQIIPSVVVHSLRDALQYTSDVMSDGFEGSILKDFSGVFKDGTSKQQLKLKLVISAEMRCTGFQEGSKGTKREGKVGSIIFENDEGTVKGRCSGFTDTELDYFTLNQDKLIGNIMEVQFNDLTKAQGNDYFALSHPRFIEWRNDKTETDTLEKIHQLRTMAIEVKM